MQAAGYDQKSLRAILLTHSPWDHVSGLPDFPVCRSGSRRRSTSSFARVDRANSANPSAASAMRSEEHTSELQSRLHLVCRLLLEKKKMSPKHTFQQLQLLAALARDHYRVCS